MIQINKTLAIFLSITLIAIGIWMMIVINGKNNKIDLLDSQINDYYIAKDKQLADSAQYWHVKSDSFKGVAVNAVKYATSLEKVDSVRHFKLTKKINEIPKHNYNESDCLSDSLLRAAGVK